MKLNFVFEKTYVRNHSDCVSQTGADLLCDYYTAYLLVFPDGLAYPSHVSDKLSYRVVRRAPALEFKHDEIACFIDREDINTPDRCLIFDAISSGWVNVKPVLSSAEVDRRHIVGYEIA